MRRTTPLLALFVLALLFVAVPALAGGEGGYAELTGRTGLGPAPGPTMAMVEGDFDENGQHELVVGTDAGLVLLAYNDSAIVELDRTWPLDGRITALTVGDLEGSQAHFVVAVTDHGQVAAFRLHSNFLEPFWSFKFPNAIENDSPPGSVAIFQNEVWLGLPGQLIQVSGGQPDRNEDGLLDSDDRPLGLLQVLKMDDELDLPTMVSGQVDQLHPQEQLLVSNSTGLWLLDQHDWTRVSSVHHGTTWGTSYVNADDYVDTLFHSEGRFALLKGGEENEWELAPLDDEGTLLAKGGEAHLVSYNDTGVLKTFDGESLQVTASVVLELELEGLAPTPHGVIATTSNGELIGFIITEEALQEAFRYHPALGGPIQTLLYEEGGTANTILVAGGSGYIYRLNEDSQFIQRSSPLPGTVLKLLTGDLESDGRTDLLALVDQPLESRRLLVVLDTESLEYRTTLDPKDLGLDTIGDMTLANLDDDLWLEVALIEYPAYPQDQMSMVNGRLTVIDFNGTAWQVEYRGSESLNALEPIVAGDIDADGRVDLALATADKALRFFSYSTWTGYEAILSPIEHQMWTITDLVLAEQDGDAHLELFVATKQAHYFIFNLEREEMVPVWQSARLHGAVTSLEVADWSNNPGMEIAVSTDNGELYLYDLDDHLLLYRDPRTGSGAQDMVASTSGLYLGTGAELLSFDIFGDEAGKTDLTFDESAFSLIPPEPVQGQPFALTLTVNNRGSLATAATLVLLAGDSPENLQEVDRQSTTEDIQARGSYDFVFDMTFVQVGRVYLAAQVLAEQEDQELSNNLAWIPVTVVTPPLPDLTWTSSGLTVDRSEPKVHQNLTFSALVENLGEADAPSTTAQLTITRDGKVILEQILEVRPIPSGEQWQLEFTWKANQADTYLFELDLNPDSALMEQDPTNNHLQRNLNIRPWQMADLSISETDILNTNPEPYLGDLVGHFFTVKNLGNLTSIETQAMVRIWHQGAIQRTVRFDVAALNQSETSRQFQFFWVPTKAGSHIIEIYLDPQGKNVERTLSNNIQLLTVEVEAERQPDLTFDQQSFTIQTRQEAEGASYLLWVLMENQGQAVAAPSQPMLKIDGTLINATGLGMQPVLYPGQLVWLEAYVDFHTPGYHTITIIADGRETVDESDEGNNELTLTVYVDPFELRPDVAPYKLLPRGTILPDQPLMMEALVTNFGGVSAEATLTVTLDDEVLGRYPMLVPTDRTISHIFNVTLAEGDHLFLLTIDGVEPADLDSGNNKLSYTLSVTVPPKVAEPKDPIVALLPVVGLVGVVGLLAAAGLSMTQWGRNHVRHLPFFLPLYSRIRRDKVLQHETRENLFNHICANPGEHLRQLATSVDLPTGTLIHHLGTLEREEYVRGVQDGVYKRFYPCGAGFEIPPPSSELGQPQIEVLNFLEQNPGASPVEVAEALDMSRQRIHYHMRNLVTQGYMKLEKTGARSVKCYIVENN